VTPETESEDGLGEVDGEPSHVRTVVTLGLLAIVLGALLIVPRLLSPPIAADEESPEGHFQAMCVVCHSFE
jgi:hypothetical protein